MLFYILSSVSVVLFFVLLWLAQAYNQFVKARNQVKTDFSDVNIQLKRRLSLVNDLADLVKSYAKHENQTFENVAKARSAVSASSSASDAAEADNIITKAVRSLYVVSEQYPELQANTNFHQLMNDIKESENQIADYREEYNKTVQLYNNMIQIFPNLLIANLFGFKEGDLFQEKTQ